jgi:ATP-dependent Clp protease ATP-binding subunit ClpX
MSSSNVTPLRRTLYCSFCGRAQSEVMLLLSGPSVYICDNCVDQCAAIVADKRAEKASG